MSDEIDVRGLWLSLQEDIDSALSYNEWYKVTYVGTESRYFHTNKISSPVVRVYDSRINREVEILAAHIGKGRTYIMVKCNERPEIKLSKVEIQRVLNEVRSLDE